MSERRDALKREETNVRKKCGKLCSRQNVTCLVGFLFRIMNHNQREINIYTYLCDKVTQRCFNLLKHLTTVFFFMKRTI